MTASLSKPEQVISRFLSTGDANIEHDSWEGNNYFEKARHSNQALRNALVKEVQQRCAGKSPLFTVPEMDVGAFARKKIEPMVRGLFPKQEQNIILDVLANAVVFLTPRNIEDVLRKSMYPKTAWDLANLFLGTMGAEPLGNVTANGNILGLSEATQCYVSMEYFACKDRFADYVVHEAAHVFHNCKRVTIGLPETRSKEWLLTIRFQDRETFAYACEAYSRILELGRTANERRTLLSDLKRSWFHGDERMDASKYLRALTEAVEPGNGWRRILACCANSRRPSHRLKDFCYTPVKTVR